MVKPERTCTVEDCDRSALHRDGGRRGICRVHLQRERRLGSVDAPVIIYGDSVARFHASYTVLDNECWFWGGAPLNGYGRALINGEHRYAHVASWEIHNGPVPDGMTVDHECHNEAYAQGECAGGVDCLHRRCVNPAHLVLRPIGENTLRGGGPAAVNARKERCQDDHEFTEANTYINPSGQRICRTCRKAYKRAWRAERKRKGLPPS